MMRSINFFTKLLSLVIFSVECFQLLLRRLACFESLSGPSRVWECVDKEIWTERNLQGSFWLLLSPLLLSYLSTQTFDNIRRDWLDYLSKKERKKAHTLASLLSYARHALASTNKLLNVKWFIFIGATRSWNQQQARRKCFDFDSENSQISDSLFTWTEIGFRTMLCAGCVNTSAQPTNERITKSDDSFVSIKLMCIFGLAAADTAHSRQPRETWSERARKSFHFSSRTDNLRGSLTNNW